MKYRATLTVDFPTKNDAVNAMNAMSHEGKGSERALSKIKCNGNTLEIAIEAEDATAFRAFINSFLRDLQVIEGLAKPK